MCAIRLAQVQELWYALGMSITETIRERIGTCGITRAEIARRTGIAESVLSRFVRGITLLDGPHIDTLGEFLGLELRQVRKPPDPPATSRDASTGEQGIQGTSSLRKRKQKAK
jgi:hypothetical protein